MDGKWWWTIPPPFSVRTFMSVHLLSGVISNSACVLAFAAPPPLFDPAMDFLRQPLAVSLSKHSGSKHVCFAGDMFHPRPSFEEILEFKEWVEKLQEDITKLMGRKVCPVDWLSFYIDCEGVWMLATPKSEQSVNNMRQALNTILVALPKEQRRAVEDSLRPLDELDAERLAAWKNVDDLRPKVRPRQCKPDLLGTKNFTRDDLTDVSFTFVRPRPGDAQPPTEPPKRAPTLAEFLEENDWTEEEDEEEAQDEGRGGDATPPRALTLHGSATMNCEAALALWTDPSQAMSSWTTENTWAARAQTQATIIIASAGVAPQLTYIRCHREARRHQLLARKLGEQYATPGMLQAVEVAADLAREGALPGYDGPRGRKSEFLRRCVDVVKEMNPSAETDITRLPEAGQAAIRRALAQEGEPYEGCLTESCLDEETTWVTRDLSMPHDEKPVYLSRCSRCGCPKTFGRTFHDLKSAMRPTLKRERAALMPKTLPHIGGPRESYGALEARLRADEGQAKRARHD